MRNIQPIMSWSRLHSILIQRLFSGTDRCNANSRFDTQRLEKEEEERSTMDFNHNFTNENISRTILTTSNGDHDEPDTDPLRVSGIFANFVLNAVLSVAATLGNTAIIYSIWYSSSLRSPSHILIFGLALCDFGVGSLVQPLYIIYQSFYIVNWRQTWVQAMVVFNFLSNMLCCVSFLTTTAVSIDRYLAVYLHLRYKRIVTVGRVVKLHVGLWLLSAFLASTVTWNITITFFAALIIISLCLLTTFTTYLKIYSVVRGHRRAIHRQHNQQSARTVYHMKTTLSMFYVCLIHALCYLPYFVFLILRDAYKLTTFTYLGTEFAQTIVFFNSTLNPLLYCWRLSYFREEVKRSLSSFSCFW